MSTEGRPRAKAPEIEGVSVIDPETLRNTDFARFRNDDLYFIDFVTFYPLPTVDAVEPKPVYRVLALTPSALFVTDLNGAMDRATRYEDLARVVYQKKTVKKLFSSETLFHIVLKVPREVDWHFSFDISKTSDTKPKSLVKILQRVWTAKTAAYSTALDQLRSIQSGGGEDGGGGSVNSSSSASLPVTELDPSSDIKQSVSKESAKDYVPPEEIKRRNKELQQMMERIESANGEAFVLQRQIEELRQGCKERQEELQSLESKYGVDLTQLRAEKQQLQQKSQQVQRQVSNGEIELVKLQADAARLREQLDEERGNYTQLVQQRLQSAGDTASNKQHEMMMLRQKAQQKEVLKAQSKRADLKRALEEKLVYSGPPALVQRAQALELRVEEALAQWSNEMDAANKIEKFLDAINTELSKIASSTIEKNEEKAALLAKWREASTAAATAVTETAVPPAAGGGGSGGAGTSSATKSPPNAGPNTSSPQMFTPGAFLGDDVLGGGGGATNNVSMTALPSSTRTMPDVDDDELFGAPPPLSQLPESKHHHTDPLDDLLDDVGPQATANSQAPPPAAVANAGSKALDDVLDDL